MGWLYMAAATASQAVKSVPRAVVSRLAWPPLVVTAVALNRAPVSARVGPTLAVVGEDGGDEGADLAEGCEGELTGDCDELAPVVPVDGFEREADVAALLDEG